MLHGKVSSSIQIGVLLKFNKFPITQPATTTLRYRHYWKNMDCDLLKPPSEVRGMTVLAIEKFNKTIQVPRLWVPEEKSQRVLPLVKKLLLKMEKLKPVKPLKYQEQEGREILLHPQPVKSWQDLPTQELEKHDIKEENYALTELNLSYDNWRADEIMKSVLPANEEGLTSYSRIGHIVHLNLRDHLMPYKDLIGQVLLQKVVGCKTVVNKAASIDNTYRNFQLDLLCGEAVYQVETKENGVFFEFDFSKVYWNPRLSTEHERIVQLLKPQDVLYDVFAGVGPFAVPAAKKQCQVLANDLNPESYKWLQHNMKRNKCLAQAQVFNKDGRDFILNELREDLLKRWQQPNANNYKIHITMNLPAMAVEFLSAFRGLFAKETSIDFSQENVNFPLVHVYSFAKGTNTKELVLQLVEENLQLKLKDNLEGVYFVRNVAPNKDMYRVSFYLTEEILKQPIAGSVANSDKEGIKRKAEVDEDEMLESSKCKVKCS
ncbi:tRNA (guanine(37)-N1)-methyltransferase isoform X2 [Lucilia sericata]|uniref:tRNA (guanine(37)-N1)-methyltransferase isoform X2 n=1 Tax=Lucilia sericata TaxID=13632 RepID=UPI0018A81DCB|nr:tRNA (guanine(37)-N1)-methyltransferase isoform X2 [Lucilia sericata]